MSLPLPRRRFGQNFLVDGNAIAWIVEQCGNGPVLEIGPGRGALTRPLATRATRLLALELDRDLVGHLNSWFPASPNVTIEKETPRKSTGTKPCRAGSETESGQSSSEIFLTTSRRQFCND